MMRPMTLGEIAAAVGCTDSYFLDNNAKITSISTDSRPQPEDGDRESCLFVALRGEVFDGHAYVGAALRNKAQYALVDKKGCRRILQGAAGTAADCLRTPNRDFWTLREPIGTATIFGW